VRRGLSSNVAPGLEVNRVWRVPTDWLIVDNRRVAKLRTIRLGEEDRALLQRRVALFCKVMSIIAVIGLCFHLVGNYDHLGEAWFAFYRADCAVIVGAWMLARSGTRSMRFSHALEIVVLVSMAVVGAFLGRYVLPIMLPRVLGEGVTVDAPGYDRIIGLLQNGMSSGLIIALTHAVVVRAALVPSGTLRTVVLTASVGVVSTAIMAGGAWPFEPYEPIRSHIPSQFVVESVISAGIWWTFTTIVCVAITRVIYGLRQEVREARQLGQYTLEEKIGAGGMGAVYRARHAMMRRPTAVKLLSPDRAGEIDLARFEREVQLTAQLTHPNTITIFDYGHTPDGVFYYAMELLDGATIEDVVRVDGPQQPGRVLKVLAEVAGALEEAHGVDLIHRDIKPANVILCRQGGKPDVAKLVDFGLVKDLAGTADAEVTSTASITGTPLYMSPESLTSPGEVDGRTDIYSLGAVGYFFLTGEHVFDARSVVEVCSHHLHTSPEPPSKRLGREVSEDLETLILDCLAKRPDDRPQSAAELLERIDACADQGAWQIADAEAWWRDHHSALADLRGGVHATSERGTIAVDLDKRKPAA